MKRLNLALWIENDSTEPLVNTNVDLHINVWKLDLNKNHPLARFIDIGIMLEQPAPGQRLCLYVPSMTFDKTHIDDLCSTFTANNNKVFVAVFNEIMTIHAEAGSKFLRAENKNTQFVSYQFDGSSTDLTIQNKVFDGSIVRFLIPSLPSTCPAKSNFYLRFRLTGDIIENAFTKDNLASDLLQYYTSKVELFDMRVNEIRTLNNSLVQHIETGSILKFKKVHFFLMCDAKEEIVLANIDQRKVRKLEEDIWEEYVKKVVRFHQKDSIVAYHWTQKPKELIAACDPAQKQKDSVCDDFSMLIKTKVDTIGKKKVIIVSAILLLLGCFASWVSSNIPTIFNNDTTLGICIDSRRNLYYPFYNKACPSCPEPPFDYSGQP